MKINIIGAGVSGLSAGCYLQMNGYQTEIFEKHFHPGGLCTSWKKGDYTIDGCAHWILGSGKGSSFYKIWLELLDMDSIPFINHDIRIDVELKNNKNKYGEKVFHLFTNLNKLEEYLIDLAPEDTATIKKFIHPMRVMQEFDLPPIHDDLPFFQSIMRRIKMTRYLELLYWFMKLKNETNFSFAEKFKNPFLKESFRVLYDDHEVSLPVITMPLSCSDKKSAGYPIGGSLGFSKRIEEKYLSLGGKINYLTPVKKIIVEDDIAKGLLVRNNVSHYSDAVISAADWHYTVFEALEGKYVNQSIVDLKNQKKLKVYYSILQVAFGVSCELKEHPHFSRFPLDEDLVLPDGTIYSRMEVHIYNYDPTMAPKGKTVIVVSFYTRKGDYWINLRKQKRNYNRVKDEFALKILELLNKKIPGIKEKVEMIDVATPATVHRYTNNWKGSVQGWLPGKNLLKSTPVGFQLPGLKNFYYSSHWSQPGGGLPVAVKAGRDIAKIICKKDKKTFVTKNTL